MTQSKRKSRINKHSGSIAWQYQVPYWLYVFLDVGNNIVLEVKERHLTIL